MTIKKFELRLLKFGGPILYADNDREENIELAEDLMSMQICVHSLLSKDLLGLDESSNEIITE